MVGKAQILLTLAALAIVPATRIQAAIDYPYEYDFVSSDSSVSGKLFLDAASSTQGTAADIGPGSYLTFNLYGGYLPPVTFNLGDLNTALDPTLNFAWNSDQITTPLDLAVGLGQNDVLLSREFVNSGNQSPIAPEYDAIRFFEVFAGANQNLLNGQSISASTVSLIASEATMDVGGGGIVYNIPFDPGASGEWLAPGATGQLVVQTVVPEPGEMALVAAFGALAFAVFGGGKGRESIGRTFLRSMLRRLPPNRG